VRYQLVIDCADADRMVRFWAAALGYELEPRPDGWRISAPRWSAP
jgi:hypothetical protein